MSIPSTTILSSDVAVGLFGEQFVRQVGEWNALCLTLLAERARGAASPWKPYLDTLAGKARPAADLRRLDPRLLSPGAGLELHPLLWDEGTRASLLAGSPMHETLGRRITDAQLSLAELMEAGAATLLSENLQLDAAQVLNEQGMRWASAALLSRGAYLNLMGEEDEDEETVGGMDEDEEDAEDDGPLDLGLEGEGDSSEDEDDDTLPYNEDVSSGAAAVRFSPLEAHARCLGLRAGHGPAGRHRDVRWPADAG